MVLARELLRSEFSFWVVTGWIHGMCLVGRCGGKLWDAMRRTGFKQGHVAAGEKRYAPSSAPKATASLSISANSLAANRVVILAAVRMKLEECTSFEKVG